MENVIKIIKQLKETSSTNDKINIIKFNSDNETFKKVLKYTYDDSMMYGFSREKLMKLIEETKPTATMYFKDGLEMLDVLSASNINDELRHKVVQQLRVTPHEESFLFVDIISKDLRCNISTKTINKAIKKLIPTWDVQQAYPREKYRLKKGEWFCLALKLNGIRSSFYCDEFRSRQNKLMEGFDHIKEDLDKLGLSNMFVDGELIRKNVDNVSDGENFRLTTSIVNSDSDNKTDIKMVVFDVITKEDFINKESKLSFKNRLNNMEHIRNNIKDLGLKNVEIMPVYYTGDDQTKIDEHLDRVDSEGLEGLMLIRDQKYKCKRHSGILKCKKFKSADCEIIGYEEGSGKYEGVLGSFIIRYKDNEVNVGSGYTDEQREQMWNDRESYIGKILEVKFKEETKDKKTGKPSLQFPTFVTIRCDKTEESYN